MNVMMLLEMASAAFPERPAFTDGSTGASFTYQQLFDAARQGLTASATVVLND